MENIELLKNLYAVHSPSGKEKKMRKFIKDYIKRNIPEVELSYDNTGNIYARKGECDSYPCVVSHIDQVQTLHERDFKTMTIDGKLFGFSPSAMDMRGLGADDKNGIWVCLRVLSEYDVMKCAFFVGEEVGCVGSSDANMDFFKDCRYVLQCDRRNGGDLITSVWGGLCSKEFLGAIDFEQFGYKETSGLSTDVATLKENGLKVSCVNISCGYYAPHTDHEYTVIAELDNCLNFVRHIIENALDVYPHEWEDYYHYPSLYGGYTRYGSYGQKLDRGWWSVEDEKDYECIKDNAEQEYDNFDDQYDEASNLIVEHLWDNMEDKDIITDVQYYFPDFDSEFIQAMIEDIRNTYSFRNFS